MIDSKPHTILICADISPLRGSEAGKAFLWLKVLLQRYTVHLVAFCDDIEEVKCAMPDGGVILHSAGPRKTTKLRPIRPLLLSRFFYRAGKQARDICEQYDIKLVHFLTPSGAHSIAPVPNFPAGVKIVRGPLGGGTPFPKGFPIPLKERSYYLLRHICYLVAKHIFLQKNFYNKMDYILIGTSNLYAVLPKSVHAKCHILFDTFVDSEMFKPKPTESDLEVTKFCFATALITPGKGLDIVIDAFSKLVEKNRNVTLDIYGFASSAKSMAEEQVKNLGLEEYVHFFNGVPRTQLPDILVRYDVICLPCLCESGGASVIEAMSCGLPVITSDYGGPRVSVRDGAGIKIAMSGRAQYTESLYQHMNKLACSPELRKSLGIGARAHVVENFSAEAFSEKILSFYAQVLSNN